MEYVITPHEGVGPVRFGMNVEDVRRHVGETPRPFSRGPKHNADAFQAQGIFAYYDKSGLCHALEFGGSTIPTLHNRPLLRRPLREVYAFLKTLDAAIQVDNAGFMSSELGIGVYVSSLREDEDWDGESEGVIVFDEEYYG